jgi:hypothetical protein
MTAIKRKGKKKKDRKLLKQISTSIKEYINKDKTHMSLIYFK